MTIPELNTIEIVLHGPETHDAHIAEVRLSRPDRSNAMNDAMWHELRKAFQWADAESEVRVVLLTGAGKNFCSGIDLSLLANVQAVVDHADPARSHERLRRLILDMQDCLSSVERCRSTRS